MKPSQLVVALELLIAQQRPAFIWGPPGIGKSDIVRQIAERLNFKLIDKRLSQSDPTELKGYPWPDAESATMRFLRDGELPETKDKGRYLIFLDELNNAPPAVQAPAYQLILDRRLGTYQLPKNAVIIAAGNRTQDRSVVHTMAAALRNRFIHLELQPDPEEWINWAVANGVSTATCGYIRWRPANLYTDDFSKNERAFPSPRSWVFADHIASDTSLDDRLKAELLCGTVGEGCATEFIGFLKHDANLPKFELILAKPETAPVPTEPSTQYAIIARLERHATVANLQKLLAYTARLPKEFDTLFMSIVMRRDRNIVDSPACTKWLTENMGRL